MELFTVKVDNADATGDLQEGDVFSLPPGIDLWAPSNGTRVVINNQGTIELESYAQWQLDQWGTNTTPANSEALADFDGDGYNNMTEFAYGLDPKVVASPGNSVFPVISLEGSDIEVSYRRRKNTSLTYHYDFSGDLITWAPMTNGVDYSESISPAGSNEQVTIDLLGSRKAARTGFIRIGVGIR